VRRYYFDRRNRVEMKAGRIGHPRLPFIRAALVSLDCRTSKKIPSKAESLPNLQSKET
jgi:hypothetical protein